MNEILYTIILLAIIAMGYIVSMYLLPLIKSKIGVENYNLIVSWVTQAVYMAQQVYGSKTGPERKEYVVKYLKQLLSNSKITITDDQLDVLIEAAVKQLRIAESAGVTCSVPSGASVDDGQVNN